MSKLYKSKITMDSLDIFRKKISSQARQLPDDSISADKSLIHKLENLIAMQLDESIFNSLKFQHK